MDENKINLLTDKIIGAAIEVHRNLGPGLLEHTMTLTKIQILKTLKNGYFSVGFIEFVSYK